MTIVVVWGILGWSRGALDQFLRSARGVSMSKNGHRLDSEGAYVSYGDALEWQIDFARAYHCVVEWKLTLRKERDGSLGSYVTAFVKPRGGSSERLLGHQVVRFGKGQDAATVPAAMVRALILLDRDLGGALDDDVEDPSASDPATPIN